MTLHLVSVIVLAAAFLYFSYHLLSTRLNGQSVLFLFIGLMFLLPPLIYLFPENQSDTVGHFRLFAYSLENTVVYVFIVVLFWGLTMLSEIGPVTIAVSFLFSMCLIWATWDPKWQPFQSIIRSFCILIAMMIATFALIKRQKNGLWMVLALMALAFALKPQVLSSAFGPFDSQNYLKALSLFFMATAISSRNLPLFGNRA